MGLPEGTQSPFVDVMDLILEYVRQFPRNKELNNVIDWKSFCASDVDTSNLIITNKPVRYSKSTKQMNGFINGDANEQKIKRQESVALKQGAKSHILFNSTFNNSTTETQRNNLRTERRTTSTCNVTVEKAFTIEKEMSLQLTAPNSVLQANGGFKKSISLTTKREKTIEEDLIWSLDTEIIVPPGYRTTASLVITEDEYDGHFEVDTIFEGSVSVMLKKKDRSIAATVVIDNLANVLTQEFGFTPLKEASESVVFNNRGRCFCNYGISQRVDLFQEKI